jgi:hypothetical protein
MWKHLRWQLTPFWSWSGGATTVAATPSCALGPWLRGDIQIVLEDKDTDRVTVDGTLLRAS